MAFCTGKTRNGDSPNCGMLCSHSLNVMVLRYLELNHSRLCTNYRNYVCHASNLENGEEINDWSDDIATSSDEDSGED